VCAPAGLSPEQGPGFEQVLETQVKEINSWLKSNDINHFESVIYRQELKAFPALVFALETAWLDWRQQGRKILYPGAFTRGQQGIPINGLVWMGDRHFMQEQIRRKLAEGYRCLKLKIGGLDFATELEILQAIRKTASAAELTIRLDANGAFAAGQALERLRQLAGYHIHSIEQPIRQGQPEAMAALARQSPVPIALDEELIGIAGREAQTALLDAIQPQYIILKPTLVGGMAAAAEWIALAREKGIGWWITSALESNIGLNAISQFTARYPVLMEQGLGTGQLYHNNIASPLTIRSGVLFYDPEVPWDNGLWD
jgi:o-succinylbenzoate synthase